MKSCNSQKTYSEPKNYLIGESYLCVLEFETV